MADEARAMLDALMGGDRNAPLPKGAALPPGRGGSSKTNNNNHHHHPPMMMTKKLKSCYDANVDPLYCAWGVDVYELFVNTKSDLGPNPRVVDEAARREYLQLPSHEQDRLGFEHVLFVKLQELVKSCDRIIARNKEKLHQEMLRMQQKQGVSYSVEDVEEQALEAVVRNMCQLEQLEEQVTAKLERLEEAIEKEREIQELVDQEHHQQAKEKKPEEEAKQPSESDDVVKKEEGEEEEEANGESKEMETETSAKEEAALVETKGATKPTEDEAAPTDNKVNEEETKKEDTAQPDQLQPNQPGTTEDGEGTKNAVKEPTRLEQDLVQATVNKQRLLFDLARLMQQYAPLQETIASQDRQLRQIKSDTTSDKTVCEVSGNFMSARDADERIAAHYAGKQYVGWRLVRDKLAEMIRQYGRYGPPPPGRRVEEAAAMGGGGPRESSRGRRYDDRGRSAGDRYHRAGSKRGPSPERWERRGGGGGGYGGGGGSRGDRRYSGGGGGRGRDYPYRGGGGGHWRR